IGRRTPKAVRKIAFPEHFTLSFENLKRSRLLLRGRRGCSEHPLNTEIDRANWFQIACSTALTRSKWNFKHTLATFEKPLNASHHCSINIVNIFGGLCIIVE
ncbi:MAG: hypothetical protein ACYCZJ_15965, partial [Sulfuriferula sp.]